MTLSVKKLLVTASFVTLGCSYMGQGMEKAEEPSTSWSQLALTAAKIPLHFTSSFFEPFIESAPHLWSALKDQAEEANKQGVIWYALDKSAKAGSAILNNPLDSITMAGAVALGWTDVADYSPVVPLTVSFVQSIKNSQTLCTLAGSIDAQTFLEKGAKIAAYTTAVYMVASMPAAAAVTLGNQFTINQDPLPGSALSSASCSQNGCFVGWTNSDGVHGRFLALDTTPLSNQFTMNQTAVATQTLPSVCMVGDTGLTIWQAVSDTFSDILGRSFLSGGTAVGSEATVNQVTANSQVGPFLTRLANGKAFATWSSGASNDDVKGRVLFSNGTADGSEFLMNQVTTGDQFRSAVAQLSNGNVMGAWEDYSAVTGRIRLRVFTETGTAVTNELAAHGTPTADQLYPTVVGLLNANANGNALLGWVNGTNINLGIFSATGTAAGNTLQLNQNTTVFQRAFSCAEYTNGDILCAWTGYLPSANSNIFARFFSSSLVPLSDEFPVPNDLFGAVAPSVATLGNGNGWVVWYGDSALNGRVVPQLSGGTTESPTTSGSPTTPTTSDSPTTSPTDSPITPTSPTTTESPITPTTSGSPTSPTTTPTPTNTPTSAGGRLEFGMLQLPSQLMYSVAHASGWLFGKLFG